MKNRITYCCTAIVMIVVLLCPFFAHAETPEGEASVRTEIMTVTPDKLSLPYDGERLHTAYANIAFGKQMMSAFKTNRRSLNDIEKFVYDALASAASEIADGIRDSSIVEIDMSGSSLKERWTEEELGVRFSEIPDPERGSILFNIVATGENYYPKLFDLSRILYSCIRDNPFDFYWMPNVFNLEYSYSAMLNEGAMKDGTKYVNIMPTLILRLPVDTLYIANGTVPADCKLDTESTGRCRTAADNAKAIVAEAADMGDKARLTFFMQRIRELSAYNHEAAETWESYPNSGPWQMIYVFDGDPDTKAVCEGFSEAFQFLCDESTFRDKTLDVYTVTGIMGNESESGKHMWNTVHRYTGNYLTDITNCLTDGSTTNSLFLSTPYTGNASDGYTMKRNTSSIKYIYNGEETGQYYSLDDLTLSAVPFAEPAYISVELNLQKGESVCLVNSDGAYSPFLSFNEENSQFTPEGSAVQYNDESHILRAVSDGDARLYLTGATQQLELKVHVGTIATFRLPDSTRIVAAEVFRKTKGRRIVLTPSLEEIDPNAFDSMAALQQLVIPEGLDSSLYAGLPGGENLLWLCCDAASANYAHAHGYPYLLLV